MQKRFQPSFLIDSNPQFHGRWTSLAPLPVRSPPELGEPLSEVLVLAGAYASEIISANRDCFARGAVLHIPFRGSLAVEELLANGG